ncbi:hypothetical protein [Olivibacter sp. SDN3]|uniref:hypothetical protein n=1 Tax=Olivibacter sp. SDN3 TaxID=2764720 RepID=UPI001C9E25AA
MVDRCTYPSTDSAIYPARDTWQRQPRSEISGYFYINDESPQIININAKEDEFWKQYVADNIKILESNHHLFSLGKHRKIMSFRLGSIRSMTRHRFGRIEA